MFLSTIVKRLFWKREAHMEAAHTCVTDRWETLNLRRFYDIKNLPDPDGDMVKQADYDLQLVSILTGVPVPDLESMPLANYQDLQARVAWIKSTPMPDVEERRRYVIDGPLGVRVFDACLDVRKWNAAQYIDYQTCLRNTETPERMAALLSVFLVPAGHEYGDKKYDLEELQSWLVDHFPALDTFALYNFFTMRLLNSMSNTETSSVLLQAIGITKEEVKTYQKIARVLAKNGVGLVSSTLLPKYRGFLGSRHLVWELSKFSTRWPI